MAFSFFVPTKENRRDLWILAVFIISMILSLWLNPARAEELESKGWKFGLSDEMKVSDSQKYLIPFADSETLKGAGGCYGPVFSASYGKRWIADFLSVCMLGATSTIGEETATGGGDLINLLGIQAGIQFDAENRKPFYSFGISVTGLAKQLLK